MSGFRFRFLAVAAPVALITFATLVLGAAFGNWGLDVIDQRNLPLDNSYNPGGTGSGVSVYILGTGINHNHYDFNGRATSDWSAFPNPDD